MFPRGCRELITTTLLAWMRRAFASCVGLPDGFSKNTGNLYNIKLCCNSFVHIKWHGILK